MSPLSSFSGVLACGLVVGCSLLTIPRAKAVVPEAVAESPVSAAPAKAIPAVWRYDGWHRDWQPGVRRPGPPAYVPRRPQAGRFGYPPRRQSYGWNGWPRRYGYGSGVRPYDRDDHPGYRWPPQWRGDRSYGLYRYDSRRVGAAYGWRAP